MLARTDFSAGMDRLQRMHGKELKPGQVAEWFDAVKHLRAFAFEEAVTKCVFEEKFFPTPGKLLDYADKAIPPAQSFPTAQQIAQTSPKDSPYTRDAKELFGKAAKRELTGLDLADAMFDMDNKWPGKGWYEAACDVMHRANLKLGVKTPPEFIPREPSRPAMSSMKCDHGSCGNIGTISPSTGEKGPLYCSEHWRAHS